MRKIYALYDKQKIETADDKRFRSFGVREISIEDAPKCNSAGFGIFWSVNHFTGARKKEEVSSIISWAVDLDSGTKQSQIKRIQNHLRPSMVIESKNGFHVYWNAIDGTAENYSEIMSLLIPALEADENAKDVSRILRVPGYNHLKDPKDPFMIKIVYENKSSYTEEQMLKIFNIKKKKEYFFKKKEFNYSSDISPSPQKSVGNNFTKDEFWEEANRIDCKSGLEKLSGKNYVNGEVFTFKRVSSGNLNIYVNGVSSSCWIDLNGRIGSNKGGGPNIIQWLKYYGHSTKDIKEIITKEFF